MTKEYDELVEVVAKSLRKSNAVESKPCLPWESYAPDAKEAIRAIQDWMPDVERNIITRRGNAIILDCAGTAEELYNNLKTMGRESCAYIAG